MWWISEEVVRGCSVLVLILFGPCPVSASPPMPPPPPGSTLASWLPTFSVDLHSTDVVWMQEAEELHQSVSVHEARSASYILQVYIRMYCDTMRSPSSEHML